MSALVATEPIIRARLHKAHSKHYRNGVLGLRAEPVWGGGDFTFEGTAVRVVACPSVLALWEAIDGRDPDAWTVVLTDVDDDELGDTVLAHLLDGRLLTPDPWEALRGNFSATTIEPALYRSPNDRAVANGLLALLSGGDYRPAPGGVLTLDHAMAILSRAVLGIVKDTDVEIDALAILEWSRSQEAVDGLVRLSADGGADLAVVFRAWLAGRAGRLATPLAALLEAGRIAELVPLGVVAGLFGADSVAANGVGLGFFLSRCSLTSLDQDVLDAWYTATRGLVINSLGEPQQQAVVDAAAGIVTSLNLTEVAAVSDLLPQGLHARLDVLAEALTAAVPAPPPRNADRILVSETALRLVEDRWAEVQRHVFAPKSTAVDACDGGVRLVRWLGTADGSATDLAAAANAYVRSGSWVDSALTKARRGAARPSVAAGLRAVIDAALARRGRDDRQFATLLAEAPVPATPVVETVLPESVIPVARNTPSLLIVVDALSLAAANDLVAAIEQHGWLEVTTNPEARRSFALAALPTLTGRSRCSLLCGELREGSDSAERSGFLALIKSAGLQAPGGVPDPIFHKAALDAVTSGASLATDVRNAIADTEHQRLIAVVLNYVDDTLHHTDPGRTDWNLDTITHLQAVLDAAKDAGRAVILTSDHGHIIDYKTGTKLDRAGTLGQRAHRDFAVVDTEREVVVEGPRVLTDDNRVVLAVDEKVRYGARNAGYHGGATPAEALVPVVVLVAGPVPDWAVPVVGVEPPWWHAAVAADVLPSPPAVPAAQDKAKAPLPQPSLFDTAEPTKLEPAARPLTQQVLASRVYRNQRQLAGRIVVTDGQIGALLAALLAAPELTTSQAAAALAVPVGSVNGALMQVKQVLDVEGYEVLGVRDGVIKLDVAALTEQFGVER
ncbi:BREX-2 system phosphatase PglZ [Mycobacterium sp. 1274756.6]|uniref:BREX-2 system phosphatase PglZ n=1 Tax=Mycobacterium sp. 1274756.6 TaxID=1834076 RepID=UPI000801E57C|nr:BREX-2 system phosphatase PglZ [Mycobacterium sp. 1274756.6]OBJ70980.1 alkaline phosphatase [Mycobacterium sp. 1274756.6]